MGSGTELRIKVKELLFDDAYLLKFVDDEKSWFTRMEVLDPIYHQFIFTANSLGSQPTTSQYFQHLAPQTLALAATAIHCALSEYASGMKAMVMFLQDEYRRTFGTTPSINYFLQATPQSITYQRPHHTPPFPPAAQLHENRRISIPVGALQPRLNHFHLILQSIPHLSTPLSHSTP